jgi:subtilisin family serine protease
VSLINRVLNYANKKGMLIVASAGNETADFDHNGNTFATWCDAVHVLCVSAVGPSTATGNIDEPAYYTNFGRSTISVAGPGGNIVPPAGQVSAWPWGNDIASWVWSLCPKTLIAGFTKTGAPILTACTSGTRLSGYIGTSQASPHVAGLAALILSENPRLRGQPGQLKLAIEKSADDLGQPGTDPYYGRGRINVKTALGL